MTARTAEIFVPFTVHTLAPIEIFASKILALSDRAAARDLFDINNMVFFKLFEGFDLVMLRKCAAFYMTVAGEIAINGFNFIPMESITPYKVRTELQPMLRNAEKFNLHAARDRVSTFLFEHMTLTEKETAFLKEFSNGSYVPQHLFEDYEIVRRIENHPMALWRLQHIRGY